MTVDIKCLNSPKINVGVAYRPPDSSVAWCLLSRNGRVFFFSFNGTDKKIKYVLNQSSKTTVLPKLSQFYRDP